MKLRYTDRSKDDIEMAFAWYERQRRGLVLNSWIEWNHPCKILQIIRRFTKYGIHVFEVAPYGGSLSQYFIQSKLMKL